MTDPIAFACLNKSEHPAHAPDHACSRLQQIHQSHGH